MYDIKSYQTNQPQQHTHYPEQPSMTSHQQYTTGSGTMATSTSMPIVDYDNPYQRDQFERDKEHFKANVQANVNQGYNIAKAEGERVVENVQRLPEKIGEKYQQGKERAGEVLGQAITKGKEVKQKVEITTEGIIDAVRDKGEDIIESVRDRTETIWQYIKNFFIASIGFAKIAGECVADTTVKGIDLFTTPRGKVAPSTQKQNTELKTMQNINKMDDQRLSSTVMVEPEPFTFNANLKANPKLNTLNPEPVTFNVNPNLGEQLLTTAKKEVMQNIPMMGANLQTQNQFVPTHQNIQSNF